LDGSKCRPSMNVRPGVTAPHRTLTRHPAFILPCFKIILLTHHRPNVSHFVHHFLRMSFPLFRSCQCCRPSLPRTTLFISPSWTLHRPATTATICRAVLADSLTLTGFHVLVTSANFGGVPFSLPFLFVCLLVE